VKENMEKTKHVKLEIILSTDPKSLDKLETTFEEALFQYCGQEFVVRKTNLTSEQMYKKIPIDPKLFKTLEVQAKEKGFANTDEYVTDLLNQQFKTFKEN
jgi:hypothetical protein